MPASFGEFTLDQSRRLLLDGDKPVPLSPKAFQLLTILVEEAPRAISKKDLQEGLWPDTFVTEGNLAGLVRELRLALRDDRKEPRFIRTLYGFGYSFISTQAPPSSPEVPVAKRTWRRGVVVPGLAALVALTAFWLGRSLNVHAPQTPAIRSIAVLPFDTSGTDRSNEHLGLGLTDVVITRLSNVSHLVVRPTSAIRRFANGHFESREAGRELKVDAVLEGSVRTSGVRIRVTVQLFDVRQQKPIWAQQFDETRAEMFTIEDDISARVVDALMVEVTPGEKRRLARRSTTNPEAYALYIEGRYRLRKGGSGAATAEGRAAHIAALAFFQQAVAKDGQFAFAWAGLAQTYAEMGWYGELPPATAYPQAEIDARKTLDLDEVSTAHVALGMVKTAWKLDYGGAEREFRRALELNPRDPDALTDLGHLLQSVGRSDEAIALRKQGVELDPLNTNLQWGLANAYLTAHRYDDAQRQIRVVLGMDPNYAEARIAEVRVAVALRRYDEAIVLARQVVESDPKNLKGQSFLGWAYGMAGRKAEAKEILRRLHQESPNENASPFTFATAYMGVGDRDAVFRLLERAVEDRQYAIRLKIEPVFEPLHADPRFVALLQRAGFRS